MLRKVHKRFNDPENRTQTSQHVDVWRSASAPPATTVFVGGHTFAGHDVCKDEASELSQAGKRIQPSTKPNEHKRV